MSRRTRQNAPSYAVDADTKYSSNFKNRRDASRPPAHIAGLTYLTFGSSPWTGVSVNTGIAAADSTLPVFSGQSIKLTSGTAGDSSGYGSFRSPAPLGTAIDLSAGKSLIVWFKQNGALPIENLQVVAYSGSGTTNSMQWNTVGTPPGADTGWFAAEFKGSWGTQGGTFDPTNVTSIRVNHVGTTGAALNIAAVAVRPAPTLYPNGVATIYLDDLQPSQLTTAMPKLASYGYPAVLAPILESISTDGVSNLTLAQIRNLHDVNGWEVAAHSDTLANHAAGFPNLSSTVVEAAFATMRQWQITNKFDDSVTWASPLGVVNPSVWTIAQKYGYRLHRYAENGAASLGSRQSAGVITAPSAIHARSWSVSNGDTVARATNDIDQAKALKGNAVFVFHAIGGTSSGATQISTADFGTIIDYINTQGLAVRTPSQILAETAAGQLLY